MATPSQNDDDRGVINPPTRSTSASAKHAFYFMSTLQQQQEELDTLVHKLDQVYGDIERKCLEAEWPWARKVFDQLTESSNRTQ